MLYTRNKSHAKKFTRGTKVQFKNSSGTAWLCNELWTVMGHTITPEDKNFNTLNGFHIDLSKRTSFTMKVTMHPENGTHPRIAIDPTEIRLPKYKDNGKLSPK